MGKLKEFHNIHLNQRAFIACNGPSLNDVPVEKLKGEIVFGLNRGYLKEGLPITYLVTADKRIEKEFKNEIILQAPGIKFCHDIEPYINRVYRYKLGMGKFSTDITKGMKLGHSVTIVALQIAYYMGCNPVYVVGMDHYISYNNTRSHSGKEYTNIGKDQNHFTADYYPPAYKFRFQNLKAVENSYREAREAFNKNGRELYNATSRTHLSEEIIPRIKLEDIL